MKKITKLFIAARGYMQTSGHRTYTARVVVGHEGAEGPETHQVFLSWAHNSPQGSTLDVLAHLGYDTAGKSLYDLGGVLDYVQVHRKRELHSAAKDRLERIA